MMTIILSVERKATLVTIVIKHSTITMMILAISFKTATRKLPHQGHPIITTDLTPTCIATTAAGTGHTPSSTDAAKGTILIGQYLINPSITEAPVTTGGTHSTLYLTMITILITLLQTDTLEDISTGIPSTNTGATHLVTHHARVSCNITPLIIAGPALGLLGHCLWIET